MLQMDVIYDELKKANGVPNVPKFDKEFRISTMTEVKSLHVNVIISPLPDAYEGGHWKVLCNTGIKVNPQNGTIEKKSDSNENEGIFSIEVTNEYPENPSEFYIVTDILFCKSDSCLKRTRRIKVVCCDDGVSGESGNGLTLSWKNLSWEK